jgi:hypothetical protein
MILWRFGRKVRAAWVVLARSGPSASLRSAQDDERVWLGLKAEAPAVAGASFLSLLF